MKKSIISLLFIASLFFHYSLWAQENIVPEKERNFPSFMDTYYDDIRDKMGIEYTLPNGFTHRYKEVSTPTFFWALLCGIVESEDNELFILFYVPPIQTKKDSAELSVFRSPERRWSLSPREMHRNSMRHDFTKISYYEKPLPDIYKEITYYPSEKAKEYYNADTVIVYDVNVKDHPERHQLLEGEGASDVMDLEKYGNCKAVMLQKNDRSFLTMYLFHSDKAAAHINDYLEKLKGIFWFREE
ncbi:MAG: hypothetical protein LBV43_05620 [Prevotella sp.]|jgi:hypothetical protein|nr:hypothetical protein [Prevotella sp.]